MRSVGWAKSQAGVPTDSTWAEGGGQNTEKVRERPASQEEGRNPRGFHLLQQGRGRQSVSGSVIEDQDREVFLWKDIRKLVIRNWDVLSLSVGSSVGRYQLCEHGQVIRPLCCSLSSSRKWG